MTDPAELLLVDGPGAGKRVSINFVYASSYVFTSWPDAERLVVSFDPTSSLMFAGPTRTVYRIGRAYNLDRQPIFVGWCSGEPEPDPEQLEYWIRFEPPIQIVAGADSWPVGCDFGMRVDEAGATVQATCRCGWETETVPRRRTSEVAQWLSAHHKISMAMGYGRDPGALKYTSIAEATRYEAYLIRAEAAGMSRSQATAIFDSVVAGSYSIDDAIERVEHRVRLFTMYGYMPLTLGDVLPSHEVAAQAIDFTTVLNSPRWMPRPLGQQFAEMSRSRQRAMVEAAIELTAQLGGDAEGWPLKRAMAAVMPHLETT